MYSNYTYVHENIILSIIICIAVIEIQFHNFIFIKKNYEIVILYREITWKFILHFKRKQNSYCALR